jgi:flagellar protein FlaG
MAINEVSTKPNLQQTQKSEVVSTSIRGSDELSPSTEEGSITNNNVLEQQQRKQLEEGTRYELDNKVAQLNDYMQNLNRSLQFQVDEQSGDTVIKVIDSETRETVRQIPSQEVLDARNAVDKYKGILLEAKV